MVRNKATRYNDKNYCVGKILVIFDGGIDRNRAAHIVKITSILKTSMNR